MLAVTLGLVMSHLKKLESMLELASRALTHGAPEIQDIPELERKNLLSIGNCLVEISNIRDRIYKIDPELKPKHMELYHSDELTYNMLDNLVAQALSAEEKEDLARAKEKFTELLSCSDLVHFQTIAQAGLYRVSLSS
jgi:hypothetical protein